MVHYIIILACFLAISVILNAILYYKLKKTFDFDTKVYKDVISLLRETCERAYVLYYQSVIAPMNAIQEPLNDKEYEKLRKDFYKSTLKHLGPNLTSYAILYLGDEDTLIRYIATFFEEKLIVDRTVNVFNSSVLKDPISKAMYYDTLARLNQKEK